MLEITIPLSGGGDERGRGFSETRSQRDTEQAEEVMVARDFALAELAGGRLHIAHISNRGSVKLIRNAKKRGINVSCEVCPYHFT